MPGKQHKPNFDSQLEEFELRCRRHGLKITPQRIAVYQTLVAMDTHPTAEEVYRRVQGEIRNISLDTVNRTLHTLSEIGAAFVVEGTGQPRRFDGGLEDHQHFLCVKCGKVIDIHLEPLDNIELPAGFQQQFHVLRKTVYLEGLCGKCMRKKDKTEPKNERM